MSDYDLINEDLTRLQLQKRAFNKLVILPVITFLTVVPFFIFGYLQNNNTFITMAVLLTGLAFVQLVSVILVRRGRLEQGVWLTIIGILLVVPVSMLFVSGFGFLGLTLPLIVILLVGDLLPQRQVALALIASIISGVITLLLDYFGAPARTESPEFFYSLIPIIVFVFLAIYAFIILRNFKNYSMRAKLISATAMVAIIAVIAVTVIVDITTRNALTNQVGANLNSLVNSQALAIGELMSRQVNTLESIGLNRALRDALSARNIRYEDLNEDEIQAELQSLSNRWQNADDLDTLVLTVLNNSTSGELANFANTFPEHVRLTLVDEQGAVVAATQRPAQFLHDDETWWEDAYNSGFGSIYISEPYEDPEIDDVVVDISIPVRSITTDGRNVIGGVLVSTYRLTALADILVTIGQERGTEIELLFQDGLELEIESEEGGFVTELTTASEEADYVHQFIESGELFQNGEFDGVWGLFSVAPVNTREHVPQVDRLGWQTVVFQPEEDALTSVSQQQQTNIILGIIIVILASITAAVVANFLARPITELTETVSQVAEGDLSARAKIRSEDEIGVLALSVNQMAEQLQYSIEGLEQRIAERTRALTTSVEVSRSLSTILNPDELIIEVVNQIRDTYEYYYVQIYLMDEASNTLRLAAGTGDAGQAMLARGHVISVNQGLVGRAAASNSSVIIPDVSQSPDWKANPLLPDTKAEIAVPISVGSTVVGVLDVQHDVTAGLTEEDIDLLQLVAFQVAISMRNAQSFAQAQRRAERELLINMIGQKIQEAPSVDYALQVAARELGQTFSGQKIMIKLENPRQVKSTNQSNGNT